jgi:alcohol dehydrogenase YqhD (iron-dependent ADH family)
MEEIKEAVFKAKAQETEDEAKAKHEKVAENLINIYADRLKKKAEELEVIDKAIERKIEEFHEFVVKTSLTGKGVIEVKKSKDQEELESSEEKIRRVMASIGR